MMIAWHGQVYFFWFNLFSFLNAQVMSQKFNKIQLDKSDKSDLFALSMPIILVSCEKIYGLIGHIDVSV